MDIAILVMLIGLNGIFAMSEIALVSARPSRLKQLAENGDRSAELALSLGGNPTRFLSTIQIGITAIGVLSGIFGEAALAVPLGAWLREFGLSHSASSLTATAIVVACITYFSIILGELVPKRIGQFNAEGIARLMARPISLLATLSSPFVLLLSASTDAVLRLIGKKETDGANLTEEDIQAMLAEGALSGVIEKHEHDMVRNVFRLDDRQIASLMTPRSEIIYLDINDGPEAIMEKVVASERSRFPVCKGGLDALLGVISAKKLLNLCMSKGIFDLKKHLRPCVFVPESLTGMKLLEQFRESGGQLVFVVDEYGEIAGIITLQDVLEALTGEFKPRHPEDVWAVQREDGSWLLDGLIPVPELKDRLGLRHVPAESRGRYNTVSGMIMWLMGSVPRTGDRIDWEGWRFEVVDLDGNRIDKVLASRIHEEDGANDQQPLAP